MTYVTLDGAQEALTPLSGEFALIHNAPHVFPSYETVPLAPLRRRMSGGIRAIFFDMDGTTTLTEDLCLLALEDTMRLLTRRPSAREWSGLDRVVDYPSIIGSSTSKNLEYLLAAYADDIDENAFRDELIRALALSLAEEPDPEHAGELRVLLAALDLESLASAPELAALPSYATGRVRGAEPDLSGLVARYASRARMESLGLRIRAGMAIYYERLHGMFVRIQLGRGREVAQELYGPGTVHAIRPLPGIGVVHALAKGWLGEEAATLAGLLQEHTGPLDNAEETLRELGRLFSAKPAQVALVTSSCDYEADIVLREVFDGLREEVALWPVSEPVRERVLAGFAEHRSFYDAVVTASHSHEIRLKPYRDLYSIALQNLGIPCEESHRVLGFEDTEAGIVAQRAAGLGVCCAIPFEGSRGHNFQAASHVLHGGLPEAVLRHGLFL